MGKYEFWKIMYSLCAESFRSCTHERYITTQIINYIPLMTRSIVNFVQFSLIMNQLYALRGRKLAIVNPAGVAGGYLLLRMNSSHDSLLYVELVFKHAKCFSFISHFGILVIVSLYSHTNFGGVRWPGRPEATDYADFSQNLRQLLIVYSEYF